MSTSQFKQCPRCQMMAPVEATLCVGCGHTYRTKFAPPAEPVDRTQMVYRAPEPPRPHQAPPTQPYWQQQQTVEQPGIDTPCLVSFALSMGGLLAFPILLGPAAVVLGIVGVNRHQANRKSRAFARWGLGIGIFCTLMGLYNMGAFRREARPDPAPASYFPPPHREPQMFPGSPPVTATPGN